MILFTLFKNLAAYAGEEYETDTEGLYTWLYGLPEYPDKASCPLISVNRFGQLKSTNGSLRHDANIVEAGGLIGDYDRGTMSPTEAQTILQMAGIESVIVTTPSHGLLGKGNRWRVIVPLSAPCSVPRRHELLTKLNTILGGVLSTESFAASQSYYVGRVQGVSYEIWRSSGVSMDQLPGILSIDGTGPELSRPRPSQVDALALSAKRASGGADQVREMLSRIPNTEPDWNEWVKVGMAVYNSTGGSDDGLEAWREWSDTCPVQGNSYDTVDDRWQHFKSSPPTSIGMGSLVFKAGGLVQQVAPDFEAPTAEPGPVLAPVDTPQITGQGAPIDLDQENNNSPILVSGYQFLAADQQIEHFKGCVYIQDAHRVYTPRGSLLKAEQFKATYGGFVFSLDATNNKTSKNAWEVFTESQAIRWPMAESTTFKPTRPSGEIITEEGRALVNVYHPIPIRRMAGDPAPLLDMLARILPDDRDRLICLSYMAAVVQYPGVKFRWWPLFQGTPGNGKSILMRCVAYAVGQRYSHFPKAKKLGTNFNSWVVNRIFLGVNDVNYAGSNHDIIEDIKPLISDEETALELKGVDQINTWQCANGMLNCNNKNAIQKTRDDRRFCIFFTAQQTAQDIERDGMGGEYFPTLAAWLKADGYAIVADYLHNFNIPDELNPATKCHRAPITSTTEQAIYHSAGSIEQEILEAIDEERPGFAGGWVSSSALDTLLDNLRLARAIPPNRRRELMQGLGYDWHPALRNGRVNNPIGTEPGKPRLYIRAEHQALSLQYPADVAAAYISAQSGTTTRLADTVFNAKRTIQ
jgi:hypothetical protein